MDQNPIVFVCEHGAAKSIVAAAYFNQMAKQRGINVRAIARGTNPDTALSEATIQGLSKDGLIPTQSSPQQLSFDDLGSAERIVSFCELPMEYQQMREHGRQPVAPLEQWDNIPPVSEDYDKSRDAIIQHLDDLIDNLRSTS